VDVFVPVAMDLQVIQGIYRYIKELPC
jgi:hypothetical protein